MIKRLEQVAALVVAAGLAIVSYWLFFSWAGGDRDQRQQRTNSEPSPGLHQPLLADAVIKAGNVGADLLGSNRQIELLAQFHNSANGSVGVLKGLAE
jgi:hypothetical protein